LGSSGSWVRQIMHGNTHPPYPLVKYSIKPCINTGLLFRSPFPIFCPAVASNSCLPSCCCCCCCCLPPPPFPHTQTHTDDSRERMAACVKVLASPSPDSQSVWLDDCRTAFSTLTSDKQSREAAEAAAASAKSYAQPDDLIDFGHLRSRKGGISQLELEDQVSVGNGGGGVVAMEWGCINFGHLHIRKGGISQLEDQVVEGGGRKIHKIGGLTGMEGVSVQWHQGCAGVFHWKSWQLQVMVVMGSSREGGIRQLELEDPLSTGNWEGGGRYRRREGVRLQWK